jgi:hypothetical protein
MQAERQRQWYDRLTPEQRAARRASQSTAAYNQRRRDRYDADPVQRLSGLMRSSRRRRGETFARRTEEDGGYVPNSAVHAALDSAIQVDVKLVRP